MKHRLLALGSVVTIATAGLVATSGTAWATCSSVNGRGWDLMTSAPSNVNGVTSQVDVVPASDLSGLNYSASGADVYVSSGSFVQIGWDAKSDGTTWAWFGESDPNSPTGEDLTDLFQISTGWHSFKLERIETGTLTGYWYAYVDNTLEKRSALIHPWGQPGFNGEVSNTCTQMYGWAQRNPSPPYSTLWYSTASNGWYPWIGDNRDGNSVFYSSPSGGTGTDYAYGG